MYKWEICDDNVIWDHNSEMKAQNITTTKVLEGVGTGREGRTEGRGDGKARGECEKKSAGEMWSKLGQHE